MPIYMKYFHPKQILKHLSDIQDSSLSGTESVIVIDNLLNTFPFI